MNIQSVDTQLTQWSGDCLSLGFFEDQVDLTDHLAALNDALGGAIADLIQEADFSGKASEQLSTRLAGAGVRYLMLIGLGKNEEFTLDGLRKKAAASAKYAKQQRCKTLGISLPLWHGEAVQSAQAIAEGIELALHQDNRFKSDPHDGKPEVELEQIDLFNLGNQAAAIERAHQICAGVILARELVNAPANIVTPMSLAETAEAIASQNSNFTAKILEKSDCEALGMGAYLGVAQASDMPPKFIHLTYRPSGTAKRKLAIVGKGLTFDSGGLNIKPTGSGIETMKMDMGGSAATLGAAKVIAALQPDVEVHFIVAATENMISGKALHPGDILTASNGKTIEINNTDAEGRLTLADALVYAEKLEVDAIVDLATLTGACIVALGNDIAGLWSPQADLAAEIKSASEQAGEKFWQLPLESAYFDGLKSSISDMKNTGPRAGGSITAALFLQKFVEKTPWAHLDVAGPVWTEKEAGYNRVGGTGFAVRTLVNWILNS